MRAMRTMKAARTLFNFRPFAVCSVLLALGSINAVAEEIPYARIKAVGSVTLDGNSVREEEIIKDGVEIRTEKDSYADIEIHETQSHLTINPNSVFTLYRPKKNNDESHVLKEGTVRARVTHRPNRNFKILTAPAIFGVRGTDFIVTTNPTFNDAEVVVLEGSVEVTSTSDPLDAKVIKASEWSGMGGRYGKKVAEPLTLPEASLKTLDKKSQSPSWVSFPTTKEKKTPSPSSSSGSSKPSTGESSGNKAE